MKILGIDVGGSGIKGAPIDIQKGVLLEEKYRIPTPNPSTPDKVIKVIREIADHFQWKAPIGCGFPSPIQRGIALKASNISKEWIGTNVEKLITTHTGLPCKVLNDADAAGLGEVTFGAGEGNKGVVFVVTVGTGLGTALFTEGILVPNTELGHIRLKPGIAEPYASDAAKKREDLSWKQWASRFNEYLYEIEHLFYPDLIIIGGGTSKKFDKYSSYFDTQTEIIPAKLLNEAGMIGAAYAARAFVMAN